jgi:hypothetical protein
VTKRQQQMAAALRTERSGVIVRGTVATNAVMNALIDQGYARVYSVWSRRQIGTVVLNERGRRAAELARELENPSTKG